MSVKFEYVYKNLEELHKRCIELDDYSVQILRDAESGQKVYFKPVCMDDFYAYGLFFNDWNQAHDFNRNWDNFTSDHTLIRALNVEDRNNPLAKSVLDAPVEIVALYLIMENDDSFLNLNYFGKDSDYLAVRQFFCNEMLKFMSSPNLKVINMDDAISTDLNLDKNLKRDLLKNAVELNKRIGEVNFVGDATLKSPVTGDEISIISNNQTMSPTNVANFEIYPTKEAMEAVTDALYSYPIPEEVKDIDNRNNLFLVIDRIGQDNYALVDLAHGELKNWSSEQKRELINKFLTITRDLVANPEEFEKFLKEVKLSDD